MVGHGDKGVSCNLDRLSVSSFMEQESNSLIVIRISHSNQHPNSLLILLSQGPENPSGKWDFIFQFSESFLCLLVELRLLD